MVEKNVRSKRQDLTDLRPKKFMSSGSDAENSKLLSVTGWKILYVEWAAADKAVVRAVENPPAADARWLSYGPGSGVFFLSLRGGG